MRRSRSWPRPSAPWTSPRRGPGRRRRCRSPATMPPPVDRAAASTRPVGRRRPPAPYFAGGRACLFTAAVPLLRRRRRRDLRGIRPRHRRRGSRRGPRRRAAQLAQRRPTSRRRRRPRVCDVASCFRSAVCILHLLKGEVRMRAAGRPPPMRRAYTPARLKACAIETPRVANNCASSLLNLQRFKEGVS